MMMTMTDADADDDDDCIINCSMGARDFYIFLEPYEKH